MNSNATSIRRNRDSVSLRRSRPPATSETVSAQLGPPTMSACPPLPRVMRTFRRVRLRSPRFMSTRPTKRASLLPPRSDQQYFGRRCAVEQETGPIGHQFSPPLQIVAPHVDATNAADDVGERGLDGGRVLRMPGVHDGREAATKTVRAMLASEAAAVEDIEEGPPAYRSPRRARVREQEIEMAAQWPERLDDDHGLRRQRHDMLGPRLHPVRRNSPDGRDAVEVLELAPHRADDLTRATGSDRE